MMRNLRVSAGAVLLAAILSACSGGGDGSPGAGPTYAVGGAVSGLSGSGLVLQNNGGDDLAISTNGTFTFATALASGAGYSVAVKTQPPAQTCTVAGGSGTIAGADVTNVTITCSANTFTVGGLVIGLSGTVVLRNNGADDLSVAADGPFIFASPVADGSPYAVTVKTQPAAQTCLVTNGTGTIAGAKVTNVVVTCADTGSPDKTFGGAGIATAGTGTDRGLAVAVDASGRVLVAGSSQNAGNTDMVIWRFKPDGTPDTTFGSNGSVVHNGAAGGNGDDFGNAIILDSSGRVLVAGASLNAAANFDMVVWRYKPDGTPDTTFGVSGIVVHHNAAGGSDDDGGSAIVLDSSGRILVAGQSFNLAGNSDLAIWRFNADGTPDATFGSNGIVVHNGAAGNSSGFDSGSAIALDTKGRILVTGQSNNLAGNSDMVIWRFNADGTPDATFNTGGIVVHHNAAGGNSNDSGSAIALDANDRVLVTGQSNIALFLTPDMVIWRYNADGTPDTTFDTDGIVVHHNAAGGDGSDSGEGIALDSSGRIVVAGWSDSPSVTAGLDADMVIWRYKPDGTPDTSFGTNGIVAHDSAAGGNSDDLGNAIVLDTAGKIIVTGQSINGSGNFDMSIWRFIP